MSHLAHLTPFHPNIWRVLVRVQAPTVLFSCQQLSSLQRQMKRGALSTTLPSLDLDPEAEAGMFGWILAVKGLREDGLVYDEPTPREEETTEVVDY